MNIVSMSLGSNQCDVSLQNAVDTAYNNGLLIVDAAGTAGISIYYTLDGSTPYVGFIKITSTST